MTEPNGGGELGNGADEPDIAAPLGCSSFSCHRAIIQLGCNSSAAAYHPLQHPIHGVGHITIHGTNSAVAINSAAPKHVTPRTTDLFKGGGFHVHAAVVHSGIGGCHVQNGLFIGTDGHRVIPAERALVANPEVVGHGNNWVKPHLVLQLHRNGVERIL